MFSNPESPIPNPLSRYWLLLGVTALAIAGLFSLVLVIARTPSLAQLPLFARLFHEALVVHVDLSVLLWFLSIACMMFSLQAASSRQPLPYVEEGALICFALGMLGIAASPLDPNATALMSNYIPVITSPVFFLGLALVLCGVALMLLRLFMSKQTETGPHSFAIYSGGFITLVSLACFIWSFMRMPSIIEGQQYFELGFWGGGHVLQFLHTQILMICWLLLMKDVCDHFLLPSKLLYALFGIGLLSALAAPLGYLGHDITSMQHREFFTHLMIAGNGIAPMVLAIPILIGLWNIRSARKGHKRAIWSTLLMSVLLFIYGGALGGLIQGQNVVIPAHYHGSIVGVTLAFMGAAYYFLPKFDCRDVSSWRLAFWQPIIYGGGQLMHISGLAWSGGYGVLRKTPGGMDALPASVKAAMGFMGLGGLIAIIGGFMFVIVVIRSVCRKN